MELEDLVEGLLADLHRISKSDAVTGSVRDAGDVKVLPLSRIAIGFGTGSVGAEGKADRERVKGDVGFEGGAVGGAVSVQPKAFVVVGADGVPHMLALKGGKRAVMRRGLELTPKAVLTEGERED
jgi:uncharacterized spore protein YtfJ